MGEFTRLRDIREDRDLTQAELAKELGIPRQQYGRYETGIYNMPLPIFKKVCGILNISPAWLLDLPESLEYPK